MPKQVTKCVIQNNSGEILLLLRGSTAPTRALTWDLPGGIVDPGETLEQAAQRELFEETGIVCGELSFVYEDSKDWGYNWNLFFGLVGSPEIKLSWEHADYIWLDKEKISSLQKIPSFLVKDIKKVIASKTY